VKVEGDAPVPETPADPLAGEETKLQVRASASASVANNGGELHAVGSPSSLMVTRKSP
ncbi:uncharacterized protein METZ01_LOCUS418895, partial [marine metagenome]